MENRENVYRFLRTVYGLSPMVAWAHANELWRYRMEDMGALLTFNHLHTQNLLRQREWDQGNTLDLIYYGNAIAGEVGELCNVIKKLERQRLGLAGSRATTGDLGRECADVLIYLDLLAGKAGVDLGMYTVLKFNETSDKLGFKTKL